MGKTVVLQLQIGSAYEALGAHSLATLRHFHPELPVVVMKERVDDTHIGLQRTEVARALFKKGYSQVFCLGADTIVLGRLDALLATDVDIVATLDFHYTPFPWLPLGGHVNADVVTFNNLGAVEAVIRVLKTQPQKFYIEPNNFAEQGAINWVIHGAGFLHRIADFPYPGGGVVYNARAHPPGQLYLEDGKVYDGRRCHVKLWHYCKGFSEHPDVLTQWADLVGEFPPDVVDHIRGLGGIPTSY